MLRIIKKVILPALVSVALLTACDQLPVRTPFQSQPRIKLGALPEVEKPADKTAKFVKQWHSGLISNAASVKLYPKILPVVEGDFVYQADYKGTVLALNKQTGKKEWQLNTDYEIASGPSLMGDTLLIGTHDAKVVALDKHSGKTNWVSSVSSEVLAPPKGNEQIVVVNTIDGKTTALNAQNGEIVWTHDYIIPNLLLRGSSTPQLTGEVTLSGLSNGKLVALNTQTGAVAWENSVANPKGRSELHRMVDIKADPIMEGDAVYAATFQGNIAKIQLATGQNQWQREISAYHNMSVDDEAVYVTDAHNHVWALNKATGETLWKQESLAKRYITAPSVIGETVIVGDRGGYLHCLDKKTGHLIARHRVGNKIVSDVIVDGNRILVSTQNGKLVVFKFVS